MHLVNVSHNEQRPRPPPPESRRLSSLPSLPSFRFSSEARSDQIVLDLIRFWKLWPSFTGFPFLWKGIKDFSIGNFMIIVEIISLNKIAAQYVSVGSYRVFFHTVYCHFWKWLSQLGNFSVNGNVAGCSTWKFDAFAFRLKRVLQHVRKWTFSRQTEASVWMDPESWQESESHFGQLTWLPLLGFTFFPHYETWFSTIMFRFKVQRLQREMPQFPLLKKTKVERVFFH